MSTLLKNFIQNTSPAKNLCQNQWRHCKRSHDTHNVFFIIHDVKCSKRKRINTVLERSCEYLILCPELNIQLQRIGINLMQSICCGFFPRLFVMFPYLLSNRVIEMPYAYQCCVYGSCDSYKAAGQWGAEQSHTEEDLHKRTAPMYPVDVDTHCKKMENKVTLLQIWAHCRINVCRLNSTEAHEGE